MDRDFPVYVSVHIQAEGELRREQKGGVTHRVWECKPCSIAWLDPTDNESPLPPRTGTILGRRAKNFAGSGNGLSPTVATRSFGAAEHRAIQFQYPVNHACSDNLYQNRLMS
jgi:hypothetical protein